MSRCEDIDNAIWDDPEFAALSPNATLLYLWSWTNPRCGMAGLYKVRLAAMMESKVPEAEIPAALAEFAETRFAFYEGNVLFVRTRVKHLRARSPKMATSIVRDVEKLPAEHPLRVKFLSEYGSWGWLRDVLPKPSRDGMETVSKNPIGKGNSHTVSDTSPDVPRTGTGIGSSSSSTKAVELPQDYPRELEPHLAVIHGILSQVAERKNAKAVSRSSLALVIMGHAHKPLVQEAWSFAAWAEDKPRRDLVSGYRNWLKNASDLAGFERLDGDGRPCGAAGQVVAIRKQSAGDLIQKLRAAEEAEA